MNADRAAEGFTLIELLISLAILGVVLAAVVYMYTNAATASAALQTRNDLLPEMQITQNYMVNKLKEAAYIFPNGANIQMSADGETTAKPDGGQNWTINTDPIVAFVVPPKTVTPNGCATATAGTSSAPSTYPTYCYAFYAFYAMKRADYLTAVTGADRPNADSNTDATTWVLVEYRGYYSSASLNTNTGFLWGSSSIPAGNRGRLLMDYLPSYSSATKLFSVAGTTVNYLTEIPGTTTVTINLASQQVIAGQTVRLPSSDPADFSSVTVYPRNVGKPQLNN